jgi:hypothetical protein
MLGRCYHVPRNKPTTTNGGPNKYARLHGEAGSGGLSIGQIDAPLLRDAIHTVVSHGDAILIGRTSDGGALSVRILSGGATECFYPTDASELLELLEGVRDVSE